MAVYTKEIVADFNFPNITIWKILANNVLSFYEVKTDSDYVMYNPNANDVEVNPETMEEVSVVYYYVIKVLPQTYNFGAFPWVAVPREGIDNKHIFDSNAEAHKLIMTDDIQISDTLVERRF